MSSAGESEETEERPIAQILSELRDMQAEIRDYGRVSRRALVEAGAGTVVETSLLRTATFVLGCDMACALNDGVPDAPLPSQVVDNLPYIGC